MKPFRIVLAASALAGTGTATAQAMPSSYPDWQSAISGAAQNHGLQYLASQYVVCSATRLQASELDPPMEAYFHHFNGHSFSWRVYPSGFSRCIVLESPERLALTPAQAADLEASSMVANAYVAPDPARRDDQDLPAIRPRLDPVLPDAAEPPYPACVGTTPTATTMTGFPLVATARVLAPSNSCDDDTIQTGAEQGTAVFVSPNLALTAAHVAKEAIGSNKRACLQLAHTGRKTHGNDADFVTRSIKVKLYANFPDYETLTRAQDDLGAFITQHKVKLKNSAPLTFPRYAAAASSYSLFDLGTVAGYPNHKPAAKSGPIFCAYHPTSGLPELLGFAVHNEGGISGGPVYVKNHLTSPYAAYQIIGIASGRHRNNVNGTDIYYGVGPRLTWQKIDEITRWAAEAADHEEGSISQPPNGSILPETSTTIFNALAPRAANTNAPASGQLYWFKENGAPLGSGASISVVPAQHFTGAGPHRVYVTQENDSGALAIAHVQFRIDAATGGFLGTHQAVCYANGKCEIKIDYSTSGGSQIPEVVAFPSNTLIGSGRNMGAVKEIPADTTELRLYNSPARAMILDSRPVSKINAVGTLSLSSEFCALDARDRDCNAPMQIDVCHITATFEANTANPALY